MVIFNNIFIYNNWIIYIKKKKWKIVKMNLDFKIYFKIISSLYIKKKWVNIYINYWLFLIVVICSNV